MNTYPKDPLETASSLKKHNDIFQNQKCSIHQNVPFEFFCFDDRTFLCGKCFKEHKKHKMEIKEDLYTKASIYTQNSSQNSVNVKRLFFNVGEINKILFILIIYLP